MLTKDIPYAPTTAAQSVFCEVMIRLQEPSQFVPADFCILQQSRQGAD